MPRQHNSERIVTPELVNSLMREIDRELDRAITKFPSFPVDPIHQVAIMAEESGEAVKAALQYVYENKPLEELEGELIQTAAMCIRCLVHLGFRH